MKSTNVTESVQLFQFILYIPTFVLGLVFNTLALWLLLCKIRKWSETTTYMTNLIIFNSFLLFSLPFKILGYKVARWTFGWSFCVFLESLYFVNMYGSILITACITVDRYIAIIHPFLANSIRSPKIALILCFLIWLVVWGGTSHIYQFHEGNNHQNCFHGFSEKMWRNAGLIVLLEVSFLSTAIIMVFCSAWIIIALGNRPELGTEGSKMSKSIAIVLANLVVFLTCFMPYHVGLLLHYLAKNGVLSNIKLTTNFLRVSLCLANINCCLDGFCYYLVIKEFLNSASMERNTKGRGKNSVFLEVKMCQESLRHSPKEGKVLIFMNPQTS
uniref:G-protein coupled receptors family 1 profile domain-containing protein n=1 Tax=Latimeria chalumnae TaxID=7897 RepID=H3A6V9_LATCH